MNKPCIECDLTNYLTAQQKIEVEQAVNFGGTRQINSITITVLSTTKTVLRLCEEVF